ncbi:MAG TPA: ATP-binding cassette domain-containing protein [Verrucomicrobiae bacterium]|nr:ATP-binding cassette domain-containing protein [Verrucomicrobiae bacterium]
MSLLRLKKLKLTLGGFTLETDLEILSDITGLFGPSGAGKTTLLEIIAGLRRPDSGTVEVRGRPLTDIEKRMQVQPEQRQIGYVPQDLALFPHKSVQQNLLFGSKELDSATEARFSHILDVLELRTLLERSPQNLSGGERQRVAIGRALMTSPQLLLLDEPLANLDSALVTKLLDLLRRTGKEFQTPMLYVTHDANELAAICEEVVILEKGKVRAHGKFLDLFEPAKEHLFVFKRQ